jgi:hypothetical protein
MQLNVIIVVYFRDISPLRGLDFSVVNISTDIMSLRDSSTFNSPDPVGIGYW